MANKGQGLVTMPRKDTQDKEMNNNNTFVCVCVMCLKVSCLVGWCKDSVQRLLASRQIYKETHHYLVFASGLAEWHASTKYKQAHNWKAKDFLLSLQFK